MRIRDEERKKKGEGEKGVYAGRWGGEKGSSVTNLINKHPRGVCHTYYPRGAILLERRRSEVCHLGAFTALARIFINPEKKNEKSSDGLTLPSR